MRPSDLTIGSALARPRLVFLLLALSCVAADLIYAVSMPQEWVGWFPTTMGASEHGAVWLSLIAAAATAWISGQARTHGFEEWSRTSPRNEASRLLPGLILVLTALTAAQGLSLLVIVGISLSHGLRGGLTGLDLLMFVPTLTAYSLFWAAFGAALGRAVRREVAILFAGFTPYAVYAALALYASDGPLAVFAVGDGRVFDYVRPSSGTIGIRMVFWILAAVTLWGFLLRPGRIQRAAAWACSLVAALAIFQGAIFVPVANAHNAVCVGSGPTTCLDVSHKTTTGRYRAEIELLMPYIPKAIQPMTVGSDENVVRGRTDRALVVPPVAGYSEPSRVIDRRMFAARFGDSLFLYPCVAREQKVTETAVTLLLWWRLEHDVPVDGSAFVGDTDYTLALPDYAARRADALAFRALSDTKRNQWFDDNASSLLGCINSGLLPS